MPPRALRDRASTSRGGAPSSSAPAVSRRARRASRAAASASRAALLEQPNFGDDGGAGLLSEEGLYAKRERPRWESTLVFR